jgi:isoleucyl-tRNA synthetase
VIVNGLILAEDGKKMSKKLKNYPDPLDLADRYGADAIRFYLLNSPAVRGEDLRFSEKGVDEIYKKVIARLENVVAFYELVSEGDEEVGDVNTLDILDTWIYARLRETVRDVTHALDRYELDRATRPFVDFLDDLSTWYVRRSRERMKGEGEEARRARAVLRDVLRTTSIILAPFTPFVAERVYAKAGDGKESVHLEAWPVCIDNTHDEEVIATMQKVRDVVSDALEVRKREGVKVRQPLATLFVNVEDSVHVSDKVYVGLIKDEVNVKEIVVDKSKTENGVRLDLNLTDELRREGQVREFLRAVQDARKAKGLSPDDMATLVVAPDSIAESLITEYKDMIQKTASLENVVFEEKIEDATEAKLSESETVVFVLR